MHLYQVTCRELVYVDRTYEIKAESPADAEQAIRESQGDAGELMDEQMQDTYSFVGIFGVFDEDGNVAG